MRKTIETSVTRRVLSFLMMLCLLVGLFPVLTTPAGAIYHADNAPAADADLLASTGDTFAATPGGGMLRVIDGELWVWGSNVGYGTGLGIYNGQPTDGSTSIPSPVKHDFDFGAPIKKVMASCNSGVTVLTEAGELYSWGSIFNEYVYSRMSQNPSSDGGRTPVKWNLENVEGTLVDVLSSSLYVTVQDDLGNWYIAGYPVASGAAAYATGGALNASTALSFHPISERYLDRMQSSYDASYTPNTEAGEDDSYKVREPSQREGGALRRTIKKLIPSYGGCSILFLTNDDRLFSAGSNNHAQNLQPDVLNEDGTYKTYGNSNYPVDVLASDQNANWVNAGPLLETLTTEGHNTSFIDRSGNVWLAGDVRAYLHPQDYIATRPRKIYDAQLNGAKAVKVYQASSVAVVLTEDNSLYAIGQNSNQFITTLQPETAAITDYTQVFADLSKNQTITGVYPTDIGVMVVTKSGEQYWAGDNSGGTAGNGTTESAPPGQIEESRPSTIPPVQPLTKNEILFELETADGTKYVSAPASGKPNRVQVTDKTGAVSYADSMEIKAGQTFKLNVYFNDFGKLNSFVVPVRFNPVYVRVVNGQGEQYADNVNYVTPGAIGASVGITKGFTTQTWSRGVLIGEGSTSGGYPKISNADGWVSVAGYTDDTKASISGKVHMFSINFTTIRSTPTNAATTFAIADETNVDMFAGTPGWNGVQWQGYDPTGIESLAHGAGWVVTNVASDAAVGNFAFNYVPESKPFPSFNTKLIQLDRIDLTMTRSDGGAVDDVTNEPVEGGSYTGKAINNANTSEIYTIKAVPTPTDASFPQVDWSVSLLAPTQSGLTTLGDYITIVEQKDTYIRFKLADGFDETMPGAIEFTATSKNDGKSGQKCVQSLTVVVKSFDAPTRLLISEKADLTDATMIYTATDDNTENKVFHVEFPDETTGFANTAVIWKLLDASGNELNASDLNNAVALHGVTPPHGAIGYEGFERGSVTVDPCHTHFGEDYVTLRVESLYDPSVYDEITIKVHLKATELKFKQEILRLPVDTSRDLLSLLQVAPENDYYATDLEWTYEPANESGPFYLITDGTSLVTSGSEPTPNGVPAVYDTVRVTDRISGCSAAIKIAVLKLDSPIMPDDIHVENLLGPLADWIEVNNLQVGDIIRFYKTFDTDYDTGIANGDVLEFGPLTAAQTPSFKFSVPNFLSGSGGELAMTVERALEGGDGTTQEFDRVPVAYDNEPSKVYGYVRLAGKMDNSARNAGIAVQLSGLSSPDVVYTDSNGYFEFKTYIAPGTYTLTLYQNNYLRRTIKADSATGYTGLVIPTAEEFAISTEDDPILLYPGDLNADGVINTTDINQYVRNWVGQYSTSLENFASYDFYDGANQVIDLNDLDLVIRRNGWVRESYPKWYVPNP